LKLKKIGFKTGIRVEHTRTDGKFVSNNTADFDNHYTEYIPSVMLSYQPDPAKSIRFSYTQRIERPGIWYLNPYVNDADPKNISQGNPKLNPEKSNSFDLSLSHFSSKWNVNLDLSYSASHNSIEGYTKVIDGISYRSYDNIGSNQYYNASFYGSLTLGKFFVYANSALRYRKIKSSQLDIQSGGWGENSYCGIQYSFPKNFKFYMNGSYSLSPAGLQSKSHSYYYTSLGVNKDLFKKKVTLSISGRDVFWYNKKSTYISQDVNFYRRSDYYNPGRCFTVRVSYRFGELKERVKKAAHGISNDDLKAGGSSGSSK
jgi:outer membrane receptor protein involved in Fe transport